jgi:hypothetical protein
MKNQRFFIDALTFVVVQPSRLHFQFVFDLVDLDFSSQGVFQLTLLAAYL